MARMAMMIKAASFATEAHFGFSWGDGGLQNTAVYAVETFSSELLAHITTTTPFDIPDGFPGLVGKRIFLDVMGTSLTRAYLDMDFKVYRPDGAFPIYQAPTRSVEVRGTCTTSFTINTTIERGGIVADSTARQFVAGMLGLLQPSHVHTSTPSEREANDERFRRCVEQRRLLTRGHGGSLGAILRCVVR